MQGKLWFLILACLLPGVSAFSSPFVDSKYYSAHAGLVPLRQSPPLDASVEADLDVIAAQRTFNGELILFQFESSRARWLDFAVNMAAQLHAVGYWHFVALAGFELDCARLHARWAEVHAAVGMPLPELLSCVFASEPAHGEPGANCFPKPTKICRDDGPDSFSVFLFSLFVVCLCLRPLAPSVPRVRRLVAVEASN